MKKIRYKIGDIIMIPIQKGKYAPARILNKVGGCALIEGFAIKPVFNRNDLPELEKLVSNCNTIILWVFDEEIKLGNWEKIGSIKVDLPIEMPMFWHCAGMSSKPEKYYLQKGKYDNPLIGEGEKIEIAQSEIKKYINVGIDSPNLAIVNFQRFLLKEGLIDVIIEPVNKNTAEITENEFEPFVMYKDEASGQFYVLLEIDGGYKRDCFEAYGMEGNGYDWTDLAEMYINETMPENTELIDFDPEGGMFVAFSKNNDALRSFIKGFYEICNNRDMLSDLLKKQQENS